MHNYMHVPVFCPCSEPSSFSVISVHGQIKFRTYQDNLCIVNYDSAVVTYSFMEYRPIYAELNRYIMNTCTMEPPYKGHLGTRHLVLDIEVVLLFGG